MLSNIIGCYREIVRESKSQSIQQISLLPYFKKLPQPPHPSAGTTIYDSYNLIKCISLIIRLESWNDSLIYWLQKGCCASRHENNMNLIVYLHQSTWMVVIANKQKYFDRNLLFWSVVLNSGLKTFSKLCCKQMSWNPGFAASFGEHRQILKDSKILFYFILLDAHAACGSSWARDRTQTTAITQVTTVTTQDP